VKLAGCLRAARSELKFWRLGRVPGLHQAGAIR